MEPTQEHWLPVPGYEGLYEVSDLGRVRSLARWVPRGKTGMRLRERLTSLTPLGNGYLTVSLIRGADDHKTTYVHVLVATTFHGPPPTGQECRHLDGNPLNNTPANLKWGTHSENQYDIVRHGRHHNAVKTHCPQGHPFDSENTYINPSSGSRMCWTCIRKRDHARDRSKSKSPVVVAA